MKNVDEFVKTMVKIELMENSDCFGHYPFQLFCEKNDGKIDINALALGGDVESCYRRFSEYKKNGAKRIYLSLDFPSGGDIDNDFVAIFSLENEIISLFAIPYKIEDGEILDTITESKLLNDIKEQFLNYL